MNKLNIDDKIIVNALETEQKGTIVTVQSMQKWGDGKILYVGTYHKNCPSGGQGYESTIQFGEDQYELIDQVTEKEEPKSTQFNFGSAIAALKDGWKVTRKGWNGNGVFIYLTTGTIVPIANLKEETAKHLVSERQVECDATIEIKSHIDMKAADGTVVIGWLASQTDMLAEDWEVVE